ncbi:Haloacid dehalogenase-like hydrolase domain-containing protein 2 [Orchesella cincta]|uniref:Haloacid dehalogenase-like hydrolase domain-containing protein 2 n=1 Tax=Orchesella cincta TaxID=48709 RepID=A0A1D2MAQ3_ORCCI|nr:Haloacid dehalogenase-like hydrolase domain-containing protein 2 [Orchesella cincta]
MSRAPSTILTVCQSEQECEVSLIVHATRVLITVPPSRLVYLLTFDMNKTGSLKIELGDLLCSMVCITSCTPQTYFTQIYACKQYLKVNNLQRPYYLVEEDVLQDFAGEYNKRFNEDCVIIGLPSTQFDYRLLSKGMNLLQNGAPMIALNLMKRSVSPDVRNVYLGPGPFVSMLTFCSDSEPVTMCKPYKEFYEALCKKIGWSDLDYSKVLVIGDDINEDIVGAKALGMKAILTRTGSYQVNDERTVCTGLTPDATVENFALAIRCVLAAQAVSQMTEDDFLQEEKSSRGCGSDLTASNDEVLTKKMQGYVNADYKSQRNKECSNVVKLPSYIW